MTTNEVPALSSVATPSAEAAEPQVDRAVPEPVMVRQGDVLLVPVEQVPSRAQIQPRRGRIVLAEGEATGHAHAVLERDARTYTTADGSRYLLAKSPAQLIHEEHGPISIAPGAYRVVIQREYEPPTADRRAGGWRAVRD